VHLLQRLHDVDVGEIRVDGQWITAVRQDSLRDALAVVPQEIGLLHRSVIDNICFERSEAADEAAFTAARAAACGGFVRGLPDGYHTIVASAGLDSRERSASASVSLGRCCSGRRFAFSRRRPRPSILRPRWRSAPPWCR
jgi:ABC-type multidrug transport system fused ATPase/permease subunit